MKCIYKVTIDCSNAPGRDYPSPLDWKYSNYFESEEDAYTFCRKAAEYGLSVYRSKHSDITSKEDSRPDCTVLLDEDGCMIFHLSHKVQKLETVSSESAYDDMIHHIRNNPVTTFSEEEWNKLFESLGLCKEDIENSETSMLAKDFFGVPYRKK